ncbi:hypothetical protein [Streptomyces bullii]|uniref:Uncharacterized protein n=1 Tax=Streptomyces bullii TaxID=349910 RepID=A0ABW0UMS6_9ACTN
MIEDPGEDPGRTSPYAALAPVGVTPLTTHAEMQDVSFELQARGLMTRRTQQAWNDLRTLRRRLLLDLFVYDLGDAGGPDDGAGDDGCGQRSGPEGGSARSCGASEEAGGPARPVGPPPPWAARLLDDLIRFDR